MPDDQKSQQLVETVEGTGLMAFDEREVVYELAGRLMQLHPNAQELGKPVMVAAAQLCLMMGINPLPGAGELHIWTQHGKPQLYVGVEFYRRKAREMGGVYWIIEPRAMTREERILYDIPENDLAAIGRAARSDDIKELLNLGVGLQDAWSMSGRTGIATATASERSAKKAGRPLSWTVAKRAETDLLKRLFPVMEKPGKSHVEELNGWTALAAPPEDGGPAAIVNLGVSDDDIIIDEQTGEVVFGPEPDPDGELAERIAEIKARNGAEQDQDALPGMEE